ncbi:hypothetical protein BS47DRAFT_65189 [Hydnum rufescens UP504]|uniref:Uncharacterized protein n=1 Tax=Hydnum rufescens UP504 TaxID=1448309 RepID=A0A9P6ARU4_9AGAM|nr:hypothetical protein BS47DRAFT_65189 [Hydnum rufescens UP504]
MCIPPCQSRRRRPRPLFFLCLAFPFSSYLCTLLILIFFFFDTWGLRIANCCSSSRDHLWIGRVGRFFFLGRVIRIDTFMESSNPPILLFPFICPCYCSPRPLIRYLAFLFFQFVLGSYQRQMQSSNTLLF